MSVTKSLLWLSTIGILLSSLMIPAASATDVPLVDGKLWQESTNNDKKSYLIGASNFISLEHAYQQKGGNPPTNKQSSVPDFFNGTEHVTLDHAIATIDDWYASHPSELNKPVLVVVWKTLVEPQL